MTATLATGSAMVALSAFTAFTIFTAAASTGADLTRPIVKPDLVFQETDGLLAIEAEHFYKQSLTAKRAWHITSTQTAPSIEPDGDPAHAEGASGGAYLEALPDTRRSHDDPLIHGENFSNAPGKMAVLHYKTVFNSPGRYYVWVRAYSTTTEDNGLHVGLDGEWPESGQRWQTVKKNGWHWDCKQRTQEVHTGVPMQLWLDVDKPGSRELQIAMREDGIEVDKLLLAKSVEFRPEGAGPKVTLAAGRMPDPFPQFAVASQASPVAAAAPAASADPPRRPNGNGAVIVSGELKQWHKVTLTLDGPFAHERDAAPNAFTDYAMHVTFTHESGSPRHKVPGYFAADGDAANSSADSGTQWRAHLSPDLPGAWTYQVSFVQGRRAAVDESAGEPMKPYDGVHGRFQVGPTDKTGRDFRARGRLQYVGKHHLQFAGSKDFFLKAGPDAPETLLAYADFDGTQASRSDVQRSGEAKPKKVLHQYAPHLGDWRPSDPVWKKDRGKALIGALNYLTAKGVNTLSFLPYNAGGDGDNVWPFVAREDKFHYDCSKLDQWGIVFDHATARGLHLHFKMQENEMDDDRRGQKGEGPAVPESLDGGKLGPERKLYCRELIARFGHALALNWNLGEENTQSTEEIVAMAGYIRETDPYKHHIVIHTFPNQQDQVYRPLLGDRSALTGASLQNHWDQTHQRTLQWVRESAAAGKAWVAANDEQGPANLGVPPDPGYEGHDGVARPDKGKAYTLHDIRKLTLWGNLMAGGAGVEYYFGYQLPQNDLVCEDFRSRDQSWDFCRIALDFFRDEKIPFESMSNANALVGNTKNDNSRYAFAKPGEVYLVYLPNGGSCPVDLSDAAGEFSIKWFNPREGGALQSHGIPSARGGARLTLTAPDASDWLAVVRKPRD